MPFRWGKESDSEAQSDKWSAAPAGGRIFRLSDFGYQIWVPEGWKLGAEPEAETGRGRPLWYRERDPHGALRVTQYKVGVQSPLEAAGGRAESLRTDPNIEELKVETKPDRVQLSWRQRVLEPGMDHVTLTRAWIVAESKGAVLVTFSIDSRNENDPRIQDELAAVREIVAKLIPL